MKKKGKLKEYKLAIEKVQENNRKAINNSSNTKIMWKIV